MIRTLVAEMQVKHANHYPIVGPYNNKMVKIYYCYTNYKLLSEKCTDTMDDIHVK